MNDTLTGDCLKPPMPQRNPPWPALAFVAILCVASMSCSVGQILVGRGAAVPTPTKTPRPTFTPLSALATPVPTPQAVVRGALPPGVTAVPPDEPKGAAAGTARTGEGSTNVILFATETPAPTPTAEPTNTAGPPPSPTPDFETNRPTPAAGPRSLPTPYVVVNADTLNVRRGPGTTFDRLDQAERGDEFMILGRTPQGDWWQVCCIANQPAWVAADLVLARGPLDAVPVLTPAPTPEPTPVPLPTDTPLPTGTPLPPFDIARGPEFPIQRDDGVLTIWVKVYEGPLDNQKPLSGYILKVYRNEEELSSPAQSYDRFDEIAQGPGASRTVQYTYNLKFEKYGAGEANWRIFLARPGGFRVSPVTEFTTMGDSYRNLVVYIAYWLAR